MNRRPTIPRSNAIPRSTDGKTRVLSLSYGKDSMACLGACELLGWPLDRIVTADVWATDDIPGWDSSVKLPFDQAAVALQTRFQGGGDRDYCLQLLSNITTGAKVTYNDTGVATTVVMQKGVALQQNQTIKPLVRLRPYRTFQEVEQPEGLFLIRIDERGITFTEADGGMWKLTARQTVAKYLKEALADEIESGAVKVML